MKRGRTFVTGTIMILAGSLAAATLVGCVGRQPDEGYMPFRAGATPEIEARSNCRERAKFRDGQGVEWVDWNKFAACMEEHGYRKPPDG